MDKRIPYAILAVLVGLALLTEVATVLSLPDVLTAFAAAGSVLALFALGYVLFRATHEAPPPEPPRRRDTVELARAVVALSQELDVLRRAPERDVVLARLEAIDVRLAELVRTDPPSPAVDLAPPAPGSAAGTAPAFDQAAS